MSFALLSRGQLVLEHFTFDKSLALPLGFEVAAFVIADAFIFIRNRDGILRFVISSSAFGTC